MLHTPQLTTHSTFYQLSQISSTSSFLLHFGLIPITQPHLASFQTDRSYRPVLSTLLGSAHLIKLILSPRATLQSIFLKWETKNLGKAQNMAAPDLAAQNPPVAILQGTTAVPVPQPHQRLHRPSHVPKGINIATC